MKTVTYTCATCETEVTRKYRSGAKHKYCSTSCWARSDECKALSLTADRPTGAEHHNWKGGRWVRPDGYVMVLTVGHPHPNHPSGRYVFEHHLVAEKMIGRFLQPQEVVHHVNGIKHDNREDNLIVCSTQAEHMLYHTSKGYKDFHSVR